MSRQAFDISEETHTRLREIARKHTLGQGAVIDAILEVLTDTNLDDACARAVARKKAAQEEKRGLRAKLHEIAKDPEKLKAILKQLDT